MAELKPNVLANIFTTEEYNAEAEEEKLQLNTSSWLSYVVDKDSDPKVYGALYRTGIIIDNTDKTFTITKCTNKTIEQIVSIDFE